MAATNNLKIFSIAARTDNAGAAVNDTDQEEMRLAVTALLGPGLLPNMLNQAANANGFQVRQNTGADMNVKVGSGTTKVDGYCIRGTVAGQGSYIVRLDATTYTVAVPATDPTNPARYGVYLFVNDTAYGGTAGRAFVDITCLRGTPAGSPVTPTALAAWSASVLLWEFQLPASATAVTNTILDAGIDRRLLATSPTQSAVSPRAFTTSTARDTNITAPTEGAQVAITGEDRLYTHNGSAWVRTGAYSSAGRTGVDVARSAVQSIATATQTTITFDNVTQDTDSFHSGATFSALTVPGGADGLYGLHILLSWGTNISGEHVWFSLNGTDYLISGPNGTASVSSPNRIYSINKLPLVATNSFGIKVYHSQGVPVNLNASLRAYRDHL